MSSQHNEASPIAIMGVMVVVVIAIVGVTTTMGQQSNPAPTAPLKAVAVAEPSSAEARRMQAHSAGFREEKEKMMVELDKLAMKYEGDWRRVPKERQDYLMKTSMGQAPMMFPSRYETLSNAIWAAKKKKLGRE